MSEQEETRRIFHYDGIQREKREKALFRNINPYVQKSEQNQTIYNIENLNPISVSVFYAIAPKFEAPTSGIVIKVLILNKLLQN